MADEVNLIGDYLTCWYMSMESISPYLPNKER